MAQYTMEMRLLFSDLSRALFFQTNQRIELFTGSMITVYRDGKVINQLSNIISNHPVPNYSYKSYYIKSLFLFCKKPK